MRRDINQKNYDEALERFALSPSELVTAFYKPPHEGLAAPSPIGSIPLTIANPQKSPHRYTLFKSKPVETPLKVASAITPIIDQRKLLCDALTPKEHHSSTGPKDNLSTDDSSYPDLLDTQTFFRKKSMHSPTEKTSNRGMNPNK